MENDDHTPVVADAPLSWGIGRSIGFCKWGLSVYFISDKIESCRFMRGISTYEGNLE